MTRFRTFGSRMRRDFAAFFWALFGEAKGHTGSGGPWRNQLVLLTSWLPLQGWGCLKKAVNALLGGWCLIELLENVVGNCRNHWYVAGASCQGTAHRACIVGGLGSRESASLFLVLQVIWIVNSETKCRKSVGCRFQIMKTNFGTRLIDLLVVSTIYMYLQTCKFREVSSWQLACHGFSGLS